MIHLIAYNPTTDIITVKLKRLNSDSPIETVISKKEFESKFHEWIKQKGIKPEGVDDVDMKVFFAEYFNFNESEIDQFMQEDNTETFLKTPQPIAQ